MILNVISPTSSKLRARQDAHLRPDGTSGSVDEPTSTNSVLEATPSGRGQQLLRSRGDSIGSGWCGYYDRGTRLRVLSPSESGSAVESMNRAQPVPVGGGVLLLAGLLP